MIHIDFTEPTSQDWQNWCARALAARQILIVKATRHERIRINDTLYKEMRDIIFAVFHGKCAYCESKFVLDQTGQVEHFRPKGKVHDEDDKPVLINDKQTGRLQPHPGYYWLAYDWHNLLPSCEKCNQTPKKRENRAIGKGNRFPVKDRTWATDPNDPNGVAQESPLLIHPLLDDPARHLILDPQTGILGYKTDEGEMTIRVFGLNLRGLPEERQRAYLEVMACYTTLTQLGRHYRKGFPQIDNDIDQALERLGKYARGEAAYAWAGRLGIEQMEAVLNLRPQVAVP
jgi:5-methylcytosine-specific restriction endonuclease McrA